MLRRLLYREAKFERLSVGQMRSLLSAFSAMLDANPQICYWVHRLDAERLLITDFFHSSMLRYRGLEVVLIENEAISYYRLPGATVGGTGHVPAGDYAVRITSPAGVSFLLDIRKNHLGRFDVQAVAPLNAGAAPAAYVELPRHVLEPSKFADEIKAAIAGSVEWTYRRYRSADSLQQPGLAEQLRSAPWLRAVQGVSPDTDAYLWMLNESINPSIQEIKESLR